MKVVDVINEDGKKLKYALPDGEDESLAESEGVNIGVPDLGQLDWDAIELELNNKLFDTGLFTMNDLLNREGVLPGVILSVLKSKIVKLYKE